MAPTKEERLFDDPSVVLMPSGARRRKAPKTALSSRKSGRVPRVLSVNAAAHERIVPSTPAYPRDRKSTRLNSSHRCISYAVFCLKKKKKKIQIIRQLK